MNNDEIRQICHKARFVRSRALKVQVRDVPAQGKAFLDEIVIFFHSVADFPREV